MKINLVMDGGNGVLNITAERGENGLWRMTLTCGDKSETKVLTDAEAAATVALAMGMGDKPDTETELYAILTSIWDNTDPDLRPIP